MLFDNATPFLDARTDAGVRGRSHRDRQASHRRGCPDGKVAHTLQFDPSQPIVIYCTCGSCHASENLAILLGNYAGFKKVYIMGAGFDACEGRRVSRGAVGSAWRVPSQDRPPPRPTHPV